MIEEYRQQLALLPLLTSLEFFISGNTPSSKNGRQWTGEYFVMSDSTRKWITKTKKEWRAQATWFYHLACVLPKPLYLEFTFVRKSKHRFDYINIAQGVMDQMKAHCWFQDDSAIYAKPYFGDFIHDPRHPGVYIRILSEKPVLPGEPKFRKKILDYHKIPEKIKKSRKKKSI